MKRLFVLILFLHLYREEFKERDNETQEETHEDDNMKLRPVRQTISHNSTNGGVCQNLLSPHLTELVIEKVTGSPNLNCNQNMNVQDIGTKDEIAIDIDKLSSNENDKNRKEVEDSKVDLTTFRGSLRNATESGTCEMENQMEVENKKDHSGTVSNSSERDVIESEGNYATLVFLEEMLLKYLKLMLWKDLTQYADKNDLKKDLELTRVYFNPYQRKELPEKKSELEDYFDRFTQTGQGKLEEIRNAMTEAMSFVGDMGLSPTKRFKFTRKIFSYAFFINVFMLQWKSSERESTFKNCYNEVKDGLIVLEKQIPFSILKKVHGWIAETYKAEKTIPDLTDLIDHCLFEEKCSASLNELSNDASHLLELFYKVYTKNWGTTKNCINAVGDTKKKLGFLVPRS